MVVSAKLVLKDLVSQIPIFLCILKYQSWGHSLVSVVYALLR